MHQLINSPIIILQVFQDWHLFLLVMLCVVVDVIVLTVVSAVDSARLEPVESDDIRHGTEVDVGTFMYNNISMENLIEGEIAIGGWDHIELHSIFVCIPLAAHLAWNVVWIQGSHSDYWSGACTKDQEC